MPHRLSWLPEALNDLIRLREFIHVHSPAAAGRAANRIRETVGKLPDNPLIGKSVDDIDDPTLRELWVHLNKRHQSPIGFFSKPYLA